VCVSVVAAVVVVMVAVHLVAENGITIAVTIAVTAAAAVTVTVLVPALLQLASGVEGQREGDLHVALLLPVLPLDGQQPLLQGREAAGCCF
jgi:hypothetical protein